MMPSSIAGLPGPSGATGATGLPGTGNLIMPKHRIKFSLFS